MGRAFLKSFSRVDFCGRPEALGRFHAPAGAFHLHDVIQPRHQAFVAGLLDIRLSARACRPSPRDLRHSDKLSFERRCPQQPLIWLSNSGQAASIIV